MKWIRNYVTGLLGRIELLEFRIRNIEKCVDVMINSPRYDPKTDWAFNGQELRKQIFRQLMAAFPITAIIETGTFVAETTSYFATQFDGPIYTCELDGRFLSLARARLSGADFLSRISFSQSQSTEFLGHLSQTNLVTGWSFFYLDAHWYNYLPIREEIVLIATSWKHFCIMIDDFKVPHDDGYGFDDYGGNQALRVEKIADILAGQKISIFFPSISSQNETGSKRGCAILVRDSDVWLLEGRANLVRGPIRDSEEISSKLE
jgi:hypothetical protein